MNLTKKFRMLRKQDGFTLVELIVVIAIVAVLGGVAVPAYSGYIEKADAAADAQILADVNKAFAAACMVEGLDNYNASGSTASVDAGKITNVTVPGADSDFFNTFKSFFDNEGEFEKTEELYYNKNIGGFADMGDNVFHKIFGNIANIDTLLEKLNISTFGDIGAEGLLTKMDDVTELAATLLGGATPGSAAESLKFALSADFETIAASMGMSSSELEAEIAAQGENADAYYNNLLSNYAVLQVANTTSGKQTADLIADLQKGSSKNEIVTMLASGENTSSKEGVAKAAMMYAMYTAYANQLEDGDTKNKALANLTDISTFANAVESETKPNTGFMNYLSTSDATKDMDGFLASMNIISSSTNGNEEATRDLLENGYGNPDLVAALQGLMG